MSEGIYSKEFRSAYSKAIVENAAAFLQSVIFCNDAGLVLLLPEKLSDINTADGFGRRVQYVDDIVSFVPRLYISLKYAGESTLYPMKIGNNAWQLDLNELRSCCSFIAKVYFWERAVYLRPFGFFRRSGVTLDFNLKKELAS